MKEKTVTVLLLLLLASAEAGGNVTLYFFRHEGCLRCEEEQAFLDRMSEKYPALEVRGFEAVDDAVNARLLLNMSGKYGFVPQGTPVTFVGSKYFNGFTFERGVLIEQEINRCLKKGCIDPLTADYIPLDETQSVESEVSFTLLGREYKIDARAISLPLFTVIVAGLDGFNPCAMWVLCFLLALLVYTRSRKRMFLVGGTFILASGIVYFLFMTAWLNMFLYVGYLTPTRLIIGFIALTAGLINVKDFFSFKTGISLTIPDSSKPKIYRSIRGIVTNVELPATLLGTVALAFTVNLIELLCTAGFPALYTRVLTMNNLTPLQHYMYLALYNIIYMLDDLAVFTIAVVTFRSRKLTETEGRWMKLAGGVMMSALGALLILKPEALMF